MTDQHPIVPSPELVKQWRDEWFEGDRVETSAYTYIANQSAFWSADQELEACCKYMQHEDFHGFAKELRAVRRPNPPSLKEQALALLQPGEPRLFNSEMQDTIRRALEALPND